VGLFNKKRKITIDDMAMKMMFSAVDSIGKLKGFNDLDDDQSMIVSLGYFYGFLKLHLNSITNLNTANIIIEKSIAYLENATKEKSSFEKFGDGVRAIEKKRFLQYAICHERTKRKSFYGTCHTIFKGLVRFSHN
jgi:hypothetical protein